MNLLSENEIFTSLDDFYGQKKYFFEQDGAPSHRAKKKTVNWSSIYESVSMGHRRFGLRTNSRKKKNIKKNLFFFKFFFSTMVLTTAHHL